MNRKAYLDWFIGNRRIMRRETHAGHACMYFGIGESRQFKGEMYKIISIKTFNGCHFDEKPYIKRAYLKKIA